MKARWFVILVPAILVLSACGGGNWSSSQVTKPGQTAQPTTTSDSTTNDSDLFITNPDEIRVYEADISNRSYTVLGDISATVNKLTAFHRDPTREQAILKLREEAAKLGADAIINVQVGQVSPSFFSWGSIDATARAVKFGR